VNGATPRAEFELDVPVLAADVATVKTLPNAEVTSPAPDVASVKPFPPTLLTTVTACPPSVVTYSTTPEPTLPTNEVAVVYAPGTSLVTTEAAPLVIWLITL